MPAQRRVERRAEPVGHEPARGWLATLNPILRGWAASFRYASAKHTFSYLGYFTW
ncbi:MAG: group II intron maturase-specific domain-containing protein [Solirubrobacteraceae bacterium]